MRIDNGIAGVLDKSELVPTNTSLPVREILGIDVCVASNAEAVAAIARDIADKVHRKYAFLNAHGANIAAHDDAFRECLRQFRVFADGIGVDIASRVLHGEPFPNNLNGTDFIPRLLSNLPRPAHIALLGAAPGVAEQAARRLEDRYSHHAFTVVSDGYFDSEREALLLQGLKTVKPDILLVAFGNPMQEKWIAQHCTGEHATVVIGVGALFDFIAERVPRAPRPWIDLRIEWLYRLLIEPRRMWKRYLLGNPAFLYRVLAQKFMAPKSAR